MLYTGNVNKLLWYTIIPALIIFYFLFRVWVFVNFDDGDRTKIANTHISKLQSLKVLNGLILGGSNSYFSLSAKQIENEMNESWYNLSILNQGYSDENYWKFIDLALSEKQKEMVATVIYSSFTPMRKETFTLRNNIKYGIEGDKSFRLTGNKSIASYIGNLILDKDDDQSFLPNAYGDMIFENYKCEINHKINRLNVDSNTNTYQIKAWLNVELKTILNTFPNAKILFVIPAEYHSKKFKLTNSYKTHNIIENEIINFSKKTDRSITLINKIYFLNKNMICDNFHHANKEGRYWLTSSILKN